MKLKTYTEAADALHSLTWTSDEKVAHTILNAADQIRGKSGSRITTAREVIKALRFQDVSMGPGLTLILEWVAYGEIKDAAKKEAK